MLVRYLFAAVAVLAAIAGLIPAREAEAQSAGQRCFTETGHCIAGPIRQYWERNGGLAVFGYPVAPQRVETVEGRTLQVQWFERDRLEIQTSGLVTAGRLGALALERQGRPWRYGPNAAPTGDCRGFRETGYMMCAGFRSYWEQNGGLERFGYPITPVLNETIEGRAYQVQYFERRRMEFHPENRGTPYEILLGLLGRDLFDPGAGGQIDVNLEQARAALYEYHSSLASADYGRAADLLIGDMSPLALMNPDITGDIMMDRKTRAALFERACTVNGYMCASVRRVVREEQIGQGAYRFTVEHAWVDGGPLRNPATGQTTWTYTVSNMNGYFQVSEFPPYFS